MWTTLEWGAVDSPEHIFIHLGKTTDEDDPEISLIVGKLPDEDEAIIPQSMTKHYKDNNELPYR